MKNTRTSMSVAAFTDTVEGEGFVVQGESWDGGTGGLGDWGTGGLGDWETLPTLLAINYLY